MSCRTCAMVIACCCLIVPACTGPIYSDGGALLSGAMTPRGRWKASGDLQNPQKAIDGDVGTAAVSASRYDNAQLTIDLGKICHFSMVVVDHGTNEFGFCRRLAVLTSEDGVTFKNQAAVPGLRRATAVVLPEQVLARYVRLQAVAAGDRPWSVAEVYLN